MFAFYAQISTPQTNVDSLLTTLAALTRLNRTEVQALFTSHAGIIWSD